MDMIFIDFYRFYFNRSKPDNLHKSSFWEINEYSIEDRSLALNRVDLATALVTIGDRLFKM